MASEIIIDPQFRDLLPTAAEEVETLEANIKADGKVTDPLIVWKERKILLDGHRRKTIAERLGLGYRVEFISLLDEEDAVRWIIKHQEGRRNLNAMQRGEIALKAKEIIAKRAEQRMKSGKANPSPKSDEGRTDDHVADMAGIGRTTLRNVEKINGRAVPEVADMARSGQVSVNAAAKVAGLPKAQQKRAVKAGPEAVKAASRVVVRDPDRNGEADPMTAFADAGRELMGKCEAVAREIDEWMDIDRETKRPRQKFAHFLTAQGTSALIREAKRNMGYGLPAEKSSKPPGFISVQMAKAKEALRNN